MNAITASQIDEIKKYIYTILPEAGMTGEVDDKVRRFAVLQANLKELNELSEEQLTDILDLFAAQEPRALVAYIEQSIAPSPIASVSERNDEAAPLTFFESIARPLIERGWKVAPCYPHDVKGIFSHGKEVDGKTVNSSLVPDPLAMRSNDPAQIHAWGLKEPEGNVCVYAVQEEGGLCFVDKDGDISLIEKYERETGKTFPRTLLVQSSIAANGTPKGHWYFQQTPKTIALQKNISEDATGGLFSFRVKNFYVAAIGSIHPVTKKPYVIVDNAPVTPMPDDFLDWLQAKVIEKPKTREEAVQRGKFNKGTRYSALISELGRLWGRGYSRELTINTGLEWARENFDLPKGAFDERLVRGEIEHFIDHGYEQGSNPDVILNQKPDSQQQPVDVSPLFNPKAVSAVRGDMSDAVLSGRLGEICQKRMLKDFPIAYAWPSICAAAGVCVPPVPSETSIFTQSEAMTTSYTGLVGPIHSGKSQAIAWARKVVGIPDNYHSEVKPASAESLLLKLNQKRNKGLLGASVLIDLDEWGFLFSKAKIENSSFSTFLQSAFYKRHHEQTMGNGKEVNFDCAISLVGGIVEDQFDLCFGANTMGGLHDRFTFGLCPDGFNFMYREFEGRPETLKPIPVRIAPEIWEMVAAIRKENPNIGREAEIAIRVAHICAAYDGRAILQAADCESMVKAFIAEQCKIRDLLKPNAGITNDAQCANALVQWLERNTPNGEIAWERDVRYGLRKTLDRLGPGVLEYCTKNLSQQGVIWYGEIANAKAYRGRKPRAYRLLTPATLEFGA